MMTDMLVGRYARVTSWDDLADVMPGGLVGLIKGVSGDGDDAELTVQFAGLKKLFIFNTNELVLLPLGHVEAALFTATHPT